MNAIAGGRPLPRRRAGAIRLLWTDGQRIHLVGWTWEELWARENAAANHLSWCAQRRRTRLRDAVREARWWRLGCYGAALWAWLA